MRDRRAPKSRFATTRGNLAVLLFTAILIAITWTAVFGVLRIEREETIRAAIERNGNFAIAFEQYALRTIEGADSVLQFVIREYALSGASTDLGRFVAEYTIDYGSFVGIVLANEHGEAVTTAYAGKPVNLTNVSDREHFRFHVEQDSGTVFIGKPVIGRFTGTPVIPVTRRINRVDGAFAGVAMALIEPARFTDVLQGAQRHALDIISLVGLDAITRARLKGSTVSWGESISKSPLLAQQVELPNGNYFGKGQLDGEARFFSYRTLPAYQLMAIVGTAEADVMREFNHRKTRYFQAAGLTSALITGFAALLMLMLASQKRAAIRIFRSQTRLLATFNQAAVGIADLTLEGRYLNVNQKLCDILGYSKAELCNQTFADGTYTDDIASSADLVGRLIADPAGITPPEHEKRYIGKDGSIVWCAVTISVVRDGSGDPEYLAVVIRDISNRKRAEKELQETETRFRTIVEQAGIGIAMVDIENGRILQCNPALAQMLGYSEGEMLGLSVEDISDSEDYQKDRELWQGLIDGTRARFQLEKRYRRKDGSSMWGMLTATIERGPKSEPLFLIGMLEDVTEMKRSQDEVTRLAGRLTATLESITDAFFTLDRDWRFTYVNRAAEHLLQSGRAQLLGKIFWDAHDAFNSNFNQEFHAAMHTMRMAEFERYHSPLRKWLGIRAYPSNDGLAIYLKDITARKHSESVIAYMAAIVESSSDAIISNDLDGVVVSWNAGAESMFGYPANEIVGRPGGQLIPADHRYEEAAILDAVRQGQRVDRFETVRSAKDGTRIDVSVAVAPIRDAAGEVMGASVVAHDVTERKKAEAAAHGYSLHLQRLSRSLMQVEEEERRQLGRELHDRTGSNLSALLLSLEVLRRKLPPESLAELGRRLDDSEALLRETMLHMRDVLAELRPPALDDFGLLAALDHHVRLLARRSDMEIRIAGTEPSPRLPPGNEISLFRIAQEALINAIAHAKPNLITVSLHPDAVQVTLIIADDGKGFDSTLQRSGAASLGLVTMRERAEAMNARFTLETSPGSGTRVIVVVPHSSASGHS